MAAWPDSVPRPQYGENPILDAIAEPLVRVPPSYPGEAREARVQGTVLIGALVGIDGRVHDVMVIRSIPQLNEAALAAVRQWTFKPAMANGKPVAVWAEIPVKFSLH